MARSEHLPIYKRGYELCLYLEQVVRGFSRYHKYGLGSELRDGARKALTLVVRANSRQERELLGRAGLAVRIPSSPRPRMKKPALDGVYCGHGQGG